MRRRVFPLSLFLLRLSPFLTPLPLFPLAFFFHSRLLRRLLRCSRTHERSTPPRFLRRRDLRLSRFLVLLPSRYQPLRRSNQSLPQPYPLKIDHSLDRNALTEIGDGSPAGSRYGWDLRLDGDLREPTDLGHCYQ